MNEQLAAVVAAPDDLSRYRVYADALLAAGDVRGELIAVGLERERAGSTEPSAREQELTGQLLPAPLRSNATLEWRRGFLRRVRLRHVGDEYLPALSALAAGELCPLLELLCIETVQFDGEGDFSNAAAVLAGGRDRFPSLRGLCLEQGLDLGNPYIEGPLNVNDVSALWAAFPRLELLELYGHQHGLGELDLSDLRTFGAIDLTAAACGALARGRLPKLETLRIGLHGLGGVPHLASASFPALKRLELFARRPQQLEQLVMELPMSTLARNIEVLSLRRREVLEPVGRTLAFYPPRGLTLEADLSHLTDATRAAVKRVYRCVEPPPAPGWDDWPRW
jgi:hypothetical protein